MFDMATLQKSKLVIAKATFADIPQIVELSQKIYADMALKPEHIKGQIRHFPEGQFVAKYDDKVVGYCATFRIKGAIAKQQHTWREITGDGFASRHDPNGDYLYGMEVFVDKAYRGLRIGQRLYDERKNVCQALELNGIIFGGRMSGFYR
jgi:GNAT superfamily N-acetyltransferase